MTAGHTTATALSGDAEQVVAVLAYALEAGLQIATVSVGTCRVELHRTGGAEAAGEERGPDRENIYDRALRGSPLAHELRFEGMPAGLEPAIGTR